MPGRKAVSRLNLSRPIPQASDDGTPHKAERRKLSPEQRMTMIAMITGVLAVAFLVFFAVYSQTHLFTPADSQQHAVVVGTRLASKFANLISQADSAGEWQADPDFGSAALGRWDPFKSLVVVLPAAPEPQPEPEPEPVPLNMTPPPPPEPPEAILTGVLRSEGRAVAIMNVQGQAHMITVGDVPFEGGVVRSIGDRLVIVSFMGRDIEYLLGGERR